MVYGICLPHMDFENICLAHDHALAEWTSGAQPSDHTGDDLPSLIRAQHYCNYALWNLEDEARRVDVNDATIAGVKRRIDGWNQTRNDYVERIDETLIAAGSAG